MYVQCERCKTEYDFDDALVSERGTTVKCTQCGNQFKVRRATEAGGDRWVVTTVSGKTHVFTSLRELQKAILGKQVARSDSLSRGSGPPRLLGAIAELEPFFDKRASMPPGAEAEPLKRPSSRPPPAAASGLQPPHRSPSAPPRGRMDTLRPTTGGVAVPPPAPVPEAITPMRSPLASTQNAAANALANTPAVAQPMTAEPFAPRPIHPSAPEPSATLPALAATQQSAQGPGGTVPIPALSRQQSQHSPTPPPTYAQPALRAQPIPAAMEMSSPLPPQAAPLLGSSDSMQPTRPSLPEYAPPHRRRVGGWIVGLVLVAGVSVLGFVVLKPYLKPGAKPVATLAPLDPRAQQLLNDGERAYSDGNLDGAKEDFDKASVLADKDPRVLLDVARVAAARADIAWLEVKLADAGEQTTRAKKELDEHSVKASSAADAALAAAPDDAAAVRSKIDALRIAGDLAQARALVPKMSSIASQPESAYVLAALDLAESAPTSQVVDRLRDAAASEGNLGRARAALVYALARSGDVAQARKELEKLLGLPHQHPLQADLRAFLDRSHPVAAAADAGTVAVVDVNALPTGVNTGAGGTGGNFGAADPRALLQQADTAKSHGDLLKAKELYGKVLQASPTDSEALAGLGDVSYQQHDLHNAQTYYENALKSNNTYFPALIGLADTLWDLGDKGRAQKMYKDMVDRLPEQMVPARARQRSSEGGGQAPAPTATQEGAP